MNSYQALSSATVMLNLSRAEISSSNSKVADSREDEFKRVLAAEVTAKSNSQKPEAKSAENLSSQKENEAAQSSGGNSEKGGNHPEVGDKHDESQHNSRAEKTDDSTDSEQVSDGSLNTRGETETQREANKNGSEHLAESAQPEGATDEAAVSFQESPDFTALPVSEAAIEDQLTSLNNADLRPLSEETADQLPENGEDTQNSETEALMALFNLIASGTKPVSGNVDPVEAIPQQGGQPVNSPLAKAIADLVSQNRNSVMTEGEQPSVLEKGIDKSSLVMQTSDSLKPNSSLSMTQMGVPVATTVDTLMKSVTSQLDGVSVRDSGTQASSIASAAVTASGRTLEGLKPAQPGAAFTLPGQLKGPVGQPQWQTAISERVAIMASQRITSAEIQLDPPELGQLQVRVTLNQEQANVSFVSQHAVVREALDQTAFRLREMFNAEGLDLVDVDVSGETFQQQREAQDNHNGAEYPGFEGDEPEPQLQVVKLSSNLVDHFV